MIGVVVGRQRATTGEEHLRRPIGRAVARPRANEAARCRHLRGGRVPRAGQRRWNEGLILGAQKSSRSDGSGRSERGDGAFTGRSADRWRTASRDPGREEKRGACETTKAGTDGAGRSHQDQRQREQHGHVGHEPQETLDDPVVGRGRAHVARRERSVTRVRVDDVVDGRHAQGIADAGDRGRRRERRGGEREQQEGAAEPATSVGAHRGMLSDGAWMRQPR